MLGLLLRSAGPRGRITARERDSKGPASIHRAPPVSGFMRFMCIGFVVLLALACADAPDPLVGTSWTLESMEPMDSSAHLPGADPITLEFLGDNQLKGSTACNSYFGIYEMEGASLRMVSLEITEAGCPTQAMFWREQDYESVLANAEEFILEGSKLTIKDGDGRMLVLGPLRS